MVTVGGVRTGMPRAADAAAVVVPRVELRVAWTEVAVAEAGTEMVAVMRTLAAATAMATRDASTPAAAATACCRLEVSE